MFEIQHQQPKLQQHIQEHHLQFFDEDSTSSTHSCYGSNVVSSIPKETSSFCPSSTSAYSVPGGSPTYSSDNSNDSTLSNSPNSSKSSNGSHSNSSSRSSSTTPIGVNLRVTGQCSQGGRKYMEDYFSVAYQQSENAKDLEYAYIGIFDGHGGAEAAIFAKEHLMMEIIKQKQFWSDNDHDVLRAIREGYIATHYAMWRDQENWPKTSNGLPSTAGTTATIAFIRREKIYIGHVGDSGIVLGYQNENEDFWRAKSLTNDHKPECTQERNRIRRAGGKVMVKSGVPRVVWKRPRNPGHSGPIRFNTLVDEIPFLAVARSLGDLWSYNPENKQFVVSPDPDVKVVRINPKTFRCLVFGTDGLWNVVGAQAAVDKVYERESMNQKYQNLNQEKFCESNGSVTNDGVQWSNPSKALVEEALKIWTAKRMRADNTSVVTVILYPANEDTAFSEANPKAHLPISYGLEYTEVQADMPLYKDSTSYTELAQKFMPPEAYRNFNYYEVEEPEVDEAEGDTESEDETENMKTTSQQVEQRIIVEVTANESAFVANNVLEQQPQRIELPVTEEEPQESESDEEENEEDFADALDVVADAYLRNRRSLPSYPDWNPSKTNLFLNDSSRDYEMIANKNESSRTEETTSNHGTDDMGSFSEIGISFAETFNCLLQNQDNHHQPSQNNLVQKSTKSYASMQEIFNEQQSMSQQEGYSLTKLETRQEKAQQQQQQQQQVVKKHQLVCSTPLAQTKESVAAAREGSIKSSSASTSCYWATANLDVQPPQIKKIVEQAAAVVIQEEEESIQLEQQMLQVPASTTMPETGVSNHPMDSFRNSNSNDGIEPQEDFVYGEILGGNIAAVQINEISSSNINDVCLEDSIVSNEDDLKRSSAEGKYYESIEVVEKIEILNTSEVIVQKQSGGVAFTKGKNAPASNASSSPRKLPSNMTALWNSFASLKSNNGNNSNNGSLKRSLSRSQISPLNSFQAKRLRTRLYPNIPNENQSLTKTTRSSNTFNRSRSHGQLANATINNNNNFLNKEKRQLRSTASNFNTSLGSPSSTNAGSLEYLKKTLRSRNTLSKDLKSKSGTMITNTSANVQNTTGTKDCFKVSSGQGQTTVIRVATPARRIASASNLQTNANSLAASINSFKSSTNSTVLNLRSRQIYDTSVNRSASTSRTDYRRNLRNINHSSSSLLSANSRTSTKSTDSNASTITTIKITPSSFSKTTKVQPTGKGNGSISLAHPPSPKLISVPQTVSTRARSLQAAKSSATIAIATKSLLPKKNSLRSKSSASMRSYCDNRSTKANNAISFTSVTTTNADPSLTPRSRVTRQKR